MSPVAGSVAFILTMSGPKVAVGIERSVGGANVFVYEATGPIKPLGVVTLNKWFHLSLLVAPRSGDTDLPRVTVTTSSFQLVDYVLTQQALPSDFSADVGLYTTGGAFSANIDNVTMDWK